METELQLYIEELVFFQRIPRNLINAVTLNPEFQNIDRLRITDISSYFQDNGLQQSRKWINSLIFYFAGRITDVDTSVDECSICLEEVHADNYAALTCGHFFHYKCIRRWIKQRDACPQCDNIIIYKCIILPNRLCSNIKQIMYLFDDVNNARHRINKKTWFNKIPPFDKSYLLYQLSKRIKLTFTEAEDHCLLDNIHNLGNLSIKLQDVAWNRVCSMLKWKVKVIICQNIIKPYEQNYHH